MWLSWTYLHNLHFSVLNLFPSAKFLLPWNATQSQVWGLGHLWGGVIIQSMTRTFQGKGDLTLSMGTSKKQIRPIPRASCKKSVEVSYTVLVHRMFLINSWWMICIENKITIKYFSRCWTAFWVVHLCPNGILLSTVKASAFLELHFRALPFPSSAGSGCPRSTSPRSTLWRLCSCALHGTSYRVSI